MTGTTTGIWAIVIVAVVCLAVWLFLVVWYAPRDPGRRHPGREPVRGAVRGGQHAEWRP